MPTEHALHLLDSRRLPRRIELFVGGADLKHAPVAVGWTDDRQADRQAVDVAHWHGQVRVAGDGGQPRAAASDVYKRQA